MIDMIKIVVDEDDYMIVYGVDEELVEINRWLFEGKFLIFIMFFVVFYVFFYIVVLNGLFIFEWIGIIILFLLMFLMEIWNFWIVYVVGVLVFGFLFFVGWIDFFKEG